MRFKEISQATIANLKLTKFLLTFPAKSVAKFGNSAGLQNGTTKILSFTFISFVKYFEKFVTASVEE